MPFDAAPMFPAALPALDIAIVGTGIAGLSAAWLLSQRHRVTVYEKNQRVGGHTNTVEVPGPDRPVPVDTGFIVYNELNYPNLVALFDHLDVPTEASDMSFAASVDDGGLEYSGSGLGGLFAQRRNLVRPRFFRMLRDTLRFYRDGAALLEDASLADLSLGELLTRGGYSDAFIADHLLPMAAAIWSTPVADMRAYPAAAFVRFCMNHGLMQVRGRPRWRTVTGGSREYVHRLTRAFADRIRTDAPIATIHRTGGRVAVTLASGEVAHHDHVVIAAHANEALAMLDDPSPDERTLLGAFPYARNRAVLHQDPALMPRRRAVWSSWNYLRGKDSGGNDAVCVTYWMNRLQNLDARAPLFVTLNPHREIAPATVLRTFDYDHPTFDLAAGRAQRSLWNLQGARNTWFCGSYFGAGFHEDALQAGLAVAEALGDVRRPWAVEGESGRIHLPAPSVLDVAA